MNIKLQDEWELGMWYEGKKNHMKEENIITSIQILRIIRKLGDEKK